MNRTIACVHGAPTVVQSMVTDFGARGRGVPGCLDAGRQLRGAVGGSDGVVVHPLPAHNLPGFARRLDPRGARRLWHVDEPSFKQARQARVRWCVPTRCWACGRYQTRSVAQQQRSDQPRCRCGHVHCGRQHGRRQRAWRTGCVAWRPRPLRWSSEPAAPHQKGRTVLQDKSGIRPRVAAHATLLIKKIS